MTPPGKHRSKAGSLAVTIPDTFPLLDAHNDRLPPRKYAPSIWIKWEANSRDPTPATTSLQACERKMCVENHVTADLLRCAVFAHVSISCEIAHKHFFCSNNGFQCWRKNTLYYPQRSFIYTIHTASKHRKPNRKKEPFFQHYSCCCEAQRIYLPNGHLLFLNARLR